jgi:hypothetical protein
MLRALPCEAFSKTSRSKLRSPKVSRDLPKKCGAVTQASPLKITF